MSRRRLARRQLRLRARIVLGFGLGSLLLALLLVLITYGLTRNSILSEREEASSDQLLRNAQQVQLRLQGDEPDFATVLDGLPSLAGSRNIVWTAPRSGDPEWTSLSLSPEDLPTGLLSTVLSTGRPHKMRHHNEGEPVLALAVSLQPPETSRLAEVVYFEQVPLTEIQDTLESLAVILAVGAAVTVLLGVSLGVWAGGRVLKPLESISEAAESIAHGRFDARVEQVADPDLRGIVESFNDMASAMQQRIARDARFSSDVSHELRSPLMTVRASLDVMQARRDELSDRSSQALDLLADDVDRFERMVQDLLEISRADSAAIESSPVNLADLVRNVIETRPEDHDIELNVRSDASNTVVIGDKRRLAQAVSNLLENAHKYAGGATEVDVESVGDRIRLSVQDRGPGVTPAERDLIFERFSRGAAARKRGNDDGAGLGLALVDEHARRHGGSVHVESRSDGERGARFVLEIPRAASR